ncbi:MAG: putative succinyl-diaminopimelate desuccinylase [Myxococcota bacterium]|nr:putative succinyl-diaminopimelate desuccinylase [Myxococcota bacterium]
MTTYNIPTGGLDWGGVGQTAAAMLADYLRIDTTNPPGREEAAAEWMRGILKEHGIESEIFLAAKERANLVARLPARKPGSKGAIVLNSHSDVVGTDEKDKWSVDPFGGIIQDGKVYGAGAIDCKSLGVMQLMSLLLLKEQGVETTRDVVLNIVADEENGGKFGAGWLTTEHWDKVAGEFTLGEGGFGFLLPNGAPLYSVTYAEKGTLWLRLRTRGPDGHGSMPRRGSAVDKLHEALGRVYGIPGEIFIGDQTVAHLGRIAEHVKWPYSFLLKRPRSWLMRRFLRKAVKKSPRMAALLTNTISVTNLRAGFKENAIPPEAAAVLDCRVHPNSSTADFLKQLHQALSGLEVEVEEILRFEPTVSPLDNGLFQSLSATLREECGARAVFPLLLPASTDMRFFRRRGVTCYGFQPLLMKLDELDAHDVDEHVAVDNLRVGVRNYYLTLRNFCAA